jgi:hypothetical protein
MKILWYTIGEHILADLLALGFHEKIDWFLESRLPIFLYVYVWICVPLSPTRTDFIFIRYRGFIRHGSMQDECEYCGFKICALHMALKLEMMIFSKTAMTILIKFWQLAEIISLNLYVSNDACTKGPKSKDQFYRNWLYRSDWFYCSVFINQVRQSRSIVYMKISVKI